MTPLDEFRALLSAHRQAQGAARTAAAEAAMRLLQELFYDAIDNRRLDLLEEALAEAAAASLDDPLHVQTLRYYRAVLLNERQDYAEAEHELVWLCTAVTDPALSARAYTALGVLYDYRQKFAAAITAYTASADRYRALNNRGGEARALKNMGIVYHELAEYDRAGELFEQAYAIARTLDDPVLTGRCLLELGYTSKQLGRWQPALDHYAQSLQIWETLHNEDYQARLHNNLGAVYLLLGDWQAAGQHFHQALDLYAAQPAASCNWREVADITHNVALLLLAEGQHAAAAERLQEALALAQSIGDATGVARAHHALGRLLQHHGDLPGAYARYAQAIACLEAVGGQIEDAELRVSFRATQQRAYEDMVLLCLAQGDAAAALSYVEQAKARVLLDQLNTGKLAQEIVHHPPLTAEAIRNALPAGVGLVEYFATGQAGPAEQMLNHLPPATAHLRALFLPPERLLAFAVTPAHLDAVALPATATGIEAVHLQRLSGRLRGTNPAPGQALAPPVRWHALHDQLVEPLVTRLEGCKQVVFVPHGVLHYLPLHALAPAGQLLQDRGLAVSYAPSASILFRTGFPQPAGLRARPAGAEPQEQAWEGEVVRCLAAGVDLDGLTHAEAEAAWAADRLGALAGAAGASTLLLGTAATPAAVKTHLPVANLVHMACHGHFRQVAPMQSGLQLVGGLLTAADILALRLQADLVVLSACDTGLNRLTHGDELFGLTRAFFAAGARSLLVTLWPVDDAAARLFMEFFYSAWIEQGATLSTALTVAQRELRTVTYATLRRRLSSMGMAEPAIECRLALLQVMWPGDRPFEHPYYWGAFMLTGNPG